MKTAGIHAQSFVDGLNARHADYGTFAAIPGVKFDKIIFTPKGTSQTCVHAFVDATGNVFKPAGWAGPAKGVRFTSVAAALAASDGSGRYLYIRS